MAELDSFILAVLPTKNASEKWLSTPRVKEALERSLGKPIRHTKTVQRRLEALEADLLVVSQQSGRELQWQRKLGVAGIASKGSGMMTSDEALAFKVLQRFAGDRIPGLVAKVISPLFEAADDCLARAQLRDSRYITWTDKTDVVDSGFSLMKPTVRADVFEQVTHALFFEQQLEIVYRAAYHRDAAREPEKKTIKPLALVESGGLLYMIGETSKYPGQPTLFRLDRITELSVLPDSFLYPESFKLSEFINARREFDLMPEGPIALQLAFRDNAGEHLKESAISSDQRLEKLPDGRLKVSGTVVLSLKLRWWLRSFGKSVEILAPKALREDFAQDAREMARQYAAPPPDALSAQN